MSSCKDKMEPVETDSCCTPRETSQHAALTMRKTGCGCAPVVEDKQSRRLVGVVTERDVCHRMVAENRRPAEVPVEEIMRAASACCGMNESLEEARRKLLRVADLVLNRATMQVFRGRREINLTATEFRLLE